MRIVCVKPEISRYDFMRLLCSALVSINERVLDTRRFVKRIHEIKHDSSIYIPDYIFDDVEFRVFVDSVVSYGLFDAIQYARTFDLIREGEKALILIDKDYADNILNSASEEVRNAFLTIAKNL